MTKIKFNNSTEVEIPSLDSTVTNMSFNDATKELSQTKGDGTSSVITTITGGGEGLKRSEIQQGLSSRLTPNSLDNPTSFTLDYTDHTGASKSVQVPYVNNMFQDFKTKNSILGDVQWKVGDFIALDGNTTYYYEETGLQMMNAYFPNVMVKLNGIDYAILNVQVVIYPDSEEEPSLKFTVIDLTQTPVPANEDFHAITLEGTPLDLTVGDKVFAAYDSKTKEMDFEFPVTISQSDVAEKAPVSHLMLIEDTIQASMEVKTYRIVAVDYTAPEGTNFTVTGVMTYRDMGGTFVYDMKLSTVGGTAQADWAQEDDLAPDYIKNKPTIPAPLQHGASFVAKTSTSTAVSVAANTLVSLNVTDAFAAIPVNVYPSTQTIADVLKSNTVGQPFVIKEGSQAGQSVDFDIVFGITPNFGGNTTATLIWEIYSLGSNTVVRTGQLTQTSSMPTGYTRVPCTIKATLIADAASLTNGYAVRLISDRAFTYDISRVVRSINTIDVQQ